MWSSTWRWSKLRRPEEIGGLLAEGGLLVRSLIGVRVDPFTRRFTLWDYTGINYMLVAERPVLPAPVAEALGRLTHEDKIVSLSAWSDRRRPSPRAEAP